MMVGRRRLIDALLLASVAAACGSAAREPAASRTPDGEVLPGRPRRVTFVAHRGGIVAGHPENTTDAFRQAIRHGVDAIEIDLRATSDGQIVVMHDETVDRTTDGRGAVADFTLAELKTLDAGRGQRIPTYEELLELVAGTEVSLLLDIKEGGTLDTREVVRLTREHDAAAGVIVGARTLDGLRIFHEIDSTLRMLGFVAAVEDVEAFIEAGVG